jgi:hypothetical protein
MAAWLHEVKTYFNGIDGDTSMRRRRYLAVVGGFALAGCSQPADTDGGPPRHAPTPGGSTDGESNSESPPGASELNTAVRALNDLYRDLLPLLRELEYSDYDADAYRPTLETATNALETAASKDSGELTGRIANVRSVVTVFETFVAAYGRLDALASRLQTALTRIRREPTASSEVIDATKTALASLRRATEDVATAVENVDTVDRALVVSRQRFTEALSLLRASAKPVETLFDGLKALRSAERQWQQGSSDYEAGSYETARATLEASVDAYEQAAAAIDGIDGESRTWIPREHVACIIESDREAATLLAKAATRQREGASGEAATLRREAMQARGDCDTGGYNISK